MGDGSQSSEIHVNVDDGDDDDFLTDEKISAFLEGSLDTDDEDDIKVALAVRAASSLIMSRTLELLLNLSLRREELVRSEKITLRHFGLKC